jgi:hypothetical protein
MKGALCGDDNKKCQRLLFVLRAEKFLLSIPNGIT